jgi:hypothetical protein
MMTRRWSSSWYRRIIRVIVLHYSHKNLILITTLQQAVKRVVIAPLILSCAQIGDNLLTSNNLAELSELLLQTSPERAWYSNIVTICTVKYPLSLNTYLILHKR